MVGGTTVATRRDRIGGAGSLGADLRAWLADHPPPVIAATVDVEGAARLREWQRSLSAAGWVGIHWPVEHGGRDASAADVAEYHVELARAGAPPLLGRAGITLVGPTLIAHGTAAQRARWLRRILSGDDVWCQLFSEPGAGSDLASLTTRAVRRGDEYRVTGQKVWSSYATFADLAIALVRSDPDAPPHRGISMLAIPMNAPGVDVRPLRQLTGDHEFNEVFLDDVAVPADHLIGPEHEGWRVANTTLANERGASFIWREQVLHGLAVAELIDGCRSRATTGDPVARQRLAGAWIDGEVFRLHNARNLERLARGEELGAESSLVKLFWADASRRLAETAVALLGPEALLTPGPWAHRLLSTRANSIMGGTSEIQRTVIGERLLGLPREPRCVTAVDLTDLVDPDRFARDGYPHDVWTHLRAHDPVARVEVAGYEPFWAVTKHADVVAVSARAVEYSSAQGITLARAGAPVLPPMDLVVLMDPPRHGPMRKLVLPWFTPKAVRARRDEFSAMARGIVDDAVAGDASGELDAVADIAAPFPLALVAWILGVPHTDWDLLFRLSNEVIGKDDPDFRRDGESPGRTAQRARQQIHACFADLVAARRRDPQGDLVSALVGSTLDGAPLADEQLLLYCELLVEAGNETTRNAISGGLLAFCEHPEAWDELRARPELMPIAVDEILRWVSPISHFTRVATEDLELRGRAIRTGDRVALYYASANRDEEVFDDPFAFRIDRSPNPHLTFGFGEHFCVGAHLARVEVELVLRHLLGRVERFELDGPVARLRSIVNGSIKRLPLRYSFG